MTSWAVVSPSSAHSGSSWASIVATLAAVLGSEARVRRTLVVPREHAIWRQLAGQHAQGQRGVGHDRDAVLDAQRQQVVLELPVEGVVALLDPVEPTMRDVLEDVGRGHVAGRDRPDLALRP